MAVVRVLIWDNENYLDRISTPEDTFLIEAIDASGSDENVIKIGYLSASAIMLGRDGIATFVSGALSGNFISGTFYGDGLQLSNVVNYINDFDGSVQLVAGDNVTIVSGSGEIVISASISGGSDDEKVRVSSNDTTSDYLFNKVSGSNSITITELNDGGNERAQFTVGRVPSFSNLILETPGEVVYSGDGVPCTTDTFEPDPYSS